ncbi:MAG TPA: ISAs1 family transposase [Anaeromyxobacteraceae bacterium]|nr:ISAs1 family transposase [Anaeromyxobacteraceae bacterium]
MRERAARRVAGLLRARLPELHVEGVPDPRAREGRWTLAQILRATLVGLMAGCRSLAETERLTAVLGPAMRRRLGLSRRLADTTARDALCRVSIDSLRAVLHRAVRAAWRRRALKPSGLPLSVVALDGKVTALPTLNHPLVQNRIEGQAVPFGLVRTVTCSLVSAVGRPCIDAIPIPAETNEVAWFQTAFQEIVKTHGGLFDVVTYDAGALSEANARAVVTAGKEYLFTLKGEQRTMFKLATELLDPRDVAAETMDVLDNQTTVTRTLSLVAVDSSWSYGDGKSPEESVWRHARAFLRVEYVKRRGNKVIEQDARLFVSSLNSGALSPRQWLLLIRSHWGVESTHHTLDTAFAEDDHPWIEADPQGMLAVLLLRRIAYTLLALYRAVTLRSDEHRASPWKELLTSVRDTLLAATEDQLTGLYEVAAATR